MAQAMILSQLTRQLYKKMLLGPIRVEKNISAIKNYRNDLLYYNINIKNDIRTFQTSCNRFDDKTKSGVKKDDKKETKGSKIINFLVTKSKSKYDKLMSFGRGKNKQGAQLLKNEDDDDDHDKQGRNNKNNYNNACNKAKSGDGDGDNNNDDGADKRNINEKRKRFSNNVYNDDVDKPLIDLSYPKASSGDDGKKSLLDFDIFCETEPLKPTKVGVDTTKHSDTSSTTTAIENIPIKIKEYPPLKECKHKDPKGPNFHRGLDCGELCVFNRTFPYDEEFTTEKKYELDRLAQKLLKKQQGFLYLKQVKETDEFHRIIDTHITRNRQQVPLYPALTREDEMFLTDINELYFLRILERNSKADWFPKLCFVRTEFLNSYENYYADGRKLAGLLKNYVNREDEEEKNVRSFACDHAKNGKIIHDFGHFLNACNGSKPYDCQILFFPAYHRLGYFLHHTLYVVDYQLKRILHFNSLPEDATDMYDKHFSYCLNVIRSVMTANAIWQTGKDDLEWDEEGWCFGHVKGIPKQPPGNSCGPFVCNYAEFYARRAPIDFPNKEMDAVNIRYRVLRSILMEEEGIPGPC